jgi:hypothetical protein
MKLKPGDTVRVIGSRGTAKIRAILTDVHGALLETQIDRFRRCGSLLIRLGPRITPEKCSPPKMPPIVVWKFPYHQLIRPRQRRAN